MMTVFVTILTVSILMETISEGLDMVGPTNYIIAIPGQDLVLPCSFQPNNISVENMTVTWFRNDLFVRPNYESTSDTLSSNGIVINSKNQQVNLVHLYENHEDRNDAQLTSYRGRTSLFKEELQKGNFSLKLSAVQPSDEGAYTCSTQSEIMYYITTIIVRLVHLRTVGPDILCAAAGEDLVLPCFTEPQINAENMTVQWSKIIPHTEASSLLVHLYEDHEDRNDAQLNSYRGRTGLFKKELQKGNTSLKLSAVQPSDEGVYMCSASWMQPYIIYDTNRITVKVDFKVAGPDYPVIAVAGEDLVLPCSVQGNFNAENMTVVWRRLHHHEHTEEQRDLRGRDYNLVHLYENHEDRNDALLKSYRGRTSLFKEELQKGNISLKLSAVQPSDEAVYKCSIESTGWYNGINVYVKMKGKDCQPWKTAVICTAISAVLLIAFVTYILKGESGKYFISALQTENHPLNEPDIRNRLSDLESEHASTRLIRYTHSRNTTIEVYDHLEPSRSYEFVPEVIQKGLNISLTYRFLCPGAGQFQCKLTSIIFGMVAKGEVLYRIMSWDSHPMDHLGQMEPAGPLYDIDCLQGSISHLHLPHCEICDEENDVELAVAHFKGDNVEIVQPLQMTNTHVDIHIQGLSHFGLLRKKIFSARPITAQVLLFSKKMADKKIKKLHVHLLPSNIPIEEVKHTQAGFKSIQISSKCQMTPGGKYKPSCGPYEFQPKVETFDKKFGPNFHPTFEVFLDTEADDFTISLLDQHGQEVWEPRRVLLTDLDSEAPSSYSAAVTFVDKNMATLIQRVSSVMEIADCLHSKNMITDGKYSDIYVGKTSQNQMRILYEALKSGGRDVKVEFYEVLKEKQPWLVSELMCGPNTAD